MLDSDGEEYSLKDVVSTNICPREDVSEVRCFVCKLGYTISLQYDQPQNAGKKYVWCTDGNV